MFREAFAVLVLSFGVFLNVSGVAICPAYSMEHNKNIHSLLHGVCQCVLFELFYLNLLWNSIFKSSWFSCVKDTELHVRLQYFQFLLQINFCRATPFLQYWFLFPCLWKDYTTRFINLPIKRSFEPDRPTTLK